MINTTGNRMSFEIARQARLAKAVERSQIAISTGKRMQRPSDDPSASTRIASIRRTQSDQASWQRNIDLGSSLTSQADGVLRTLNERLGRVQELVVQGASAALSPRDRVTIAAEIRGIAKEVETLKLAQSSLGQPLFGSGTPREIRFAHEVVFAPIPAQATIFEASGQPLEQHLTRFAMAVESGDRGLLEPALVDASSLVAHGSDAAALIGNAASRLQRLAEANASRTIDLATERSLIEDSDITTVISTLNAQQLTLEAAQAAFARINRRTLIDLLS